MFESLFGSKTRVKLLSLFLNNPNRQYYVREITRIIDEQINSVRRELSNLLAIGIISSDSNNNRLYYEVNQDYQFYAPLRSIFTNIAAEEPQLQETREEDMVAKKLRTTGKIELAFLTGSFTRDPLAETDLFIMGDVNRSKVAKTVSEIEGDMNRGINYTIMTPEDFAYRQRMNDRFLMGVLDAKRVPLIDESAKRVKKAPAKLVDDIPEVSVPVEVEIKAEG
ncbi:MAG TPA: transcriptional regulator [Candidatus Saccharimonadales bacterium]|nr:transcriptional regulator [Candidatus Saccharimonadales bacterium]